MTPPIPGARYAVTPKEYEASYEADLRLHPGIDRIPPRRPWG